MRYRMKKILFLCVVTLSLNACSPQRLQSAQIIDYHEGRPVYAMTGFTDSGDTASGTSKRYVEYAMASACPDGIRIVSLSEQEMHNGCCKFLYWSAKAECN